jgi:hypothetical protein
MITCLSDSFSHPFIQLSALLQPIGLQDENPEKRPFSLLSGNRKRGIYSIKKSLYSHQ